MEREVLAMPGCSIRIDEDKIMLLNNGVPRSGTRSGNRLVWHYNHKGYDAEKVIEQTFPELRKRDYIYTLYRDFKEEYRSRTMTKEILPGIYLVKLYTPTTYYIETPIELDLKKVIGRLFPGIHINIIEGDARREHRENYFVSTECLRMVEQRILDFFEDHPGFLDLA